MRKQNYFKKILGGTMFLSLAVFCGFWLSRSKPAQCQLQVSRYVGGARCQSCHKQEHKTWLNSAHAKAFDRLPKAARKKVLCVSCHSIGTASHLQGVQCESCHGGGRDYVQPEVMTDPVLARAVGLRVKKGAAACVSCHSSYHSPKIRKFDYKKMWGKIKHGK